MGTAGAGAALAETAVGDLDGVRAVRVGYVDVAVAGVRESPRHHRCRLGGTRLRAAERLDRERDADPGEERDQSDHGGSLASARAVATALEDLEPERLDRGALDLALEERTELRHLQPPSSPETLIAPDRPVLERSRP